MQFIWNNVEKGIIHHAIYQSIDQLINQQTNQPINQSLVWLEMLYFVKEHTFIVYSHIVKTV